MPTSTLWLQWEKQYKKYKKDNDCSNKLKDVHKEMLRQINLTESQAECNAIANKFNHLIHQNGFDNFQQNLLKKLNEEMQFDINGENKVSFIGKNNFRITSQRLEINKQEYLNQLKRFQGTKEELVQVLNDKESDLYKLKKAVDSENGRLNTIRGQVLESFFKIVSELGNETINKMAEDKLEELMGLLNIQLLNSKKLSQTKGNDTESINVEINDELIKVISSKIKVDVTLPSPMGGKEEWHSSIKNYSAVRDISLVSNASVIGMISQGMKGNGSLQKYVYNAFTIPSDKGEALDSASLNNLKKMFIIQALSGQKVEETKANVLILSINNSKNPIRIISIPLLYKVGLEDLKLGLFKFKPEIEEMLPAYNEKTSRPENVFDMVNALTVSVELSKETIKVSKLKEYAKL